MSDEVNAPVEAVAPSLLQLSVIGGVAVVLQQIPWAVGLAVPKSLIVPLPVAVVKVMEVTACVVTVGGDEREPRLIACGVPLQATDTADGELAQMSKEMSSKPRSLPIVPV